MHSFTREMSFFRHLWESFNFGGFFEGFADLLGKYLCLPNVNDFDATD